MAEFFLYGNKEEQEFPFDSIRDQIATLAKEAPEIPHEFGDFINILLVFAGARTSTFQFGKKQMINQLVTTLNGILPSPQKSNFILCVDEVLNGQSIFRKNSPRYIRKDRLTERELGRNLDYFAAGHCHERGPTCVIHIYEVTTGFNIHSEIALKNYMSGDDENRFEEFMERKVLLYNECCKRMGLEYRFVWCRYDKMGEEIAEILMNESLPAMDWWGKNWPSVFTSARIKYTSKLQAIINSDLEKTWPVIKTILSFYRSQGVEISLDINRDWAREVEQVIVSTNNHFTANPNLDVENELNGLTEALHGLDKTRTKFTIQQLNRHWPKSKDILVLFHLISKDIQYMFSPQPPPPRLPPFTGIERVPAISDSYWRYRRVLYKRVLKALLTIDGLDWC